MKKNIIIFYSQSLSSHLLYQEFIEKYKDNIACLVRFPVVPRRQKTQLHNKPMFVRVLKKSSLEFLFFNLCTITLYNIFATIFFNTLAHKARRLDIPVKYFRTIDEACIAYVQSHNPEWVFNNSPNILKNNILSVPALGTLNYHAAKLPEYRGAGNYFWVMAEEEKEAMATLHYVTEGLDAGDIISYSTIVPITSQTSIFRLWYTLRYHAFSTFEKVMSYVLDSQPIPAKPQDEACAGVRSFPDSEASRMVRERGHSIIRFKEFVHIIRTAITGRIQREESEVI